MPGPDNALVRLLVEKYGIPPEEADAYAYDILGENSTRSTSLQEEALGGVADEQLVAMERLGRFPQTAQKVSTGQEMAGRPVFQSDLASYAELLDNSRRITQDEARRSFEERGQRRAGSRDELEAHAADMQSRADANYVTDPRTGTRIPRPTHWVTNEQGIPTPVTEIAVQPINPYEVKLQRAIDLRKSVLGR